MGLKEHGDPPSFYAVANDLAATQLSLRVFLRTPHAQMPNVVLNESETAAVIDNILSLRR
jgi:hypothetical protein